MSYYVDRTIIEAEGAAPRQGWTGPMRSEAQATREAAAWRDAGWTAEVVESTPDVRARVRAWQKRVQATRGR